MAECEHLVRTTRYFDGALGAGDEATAAAHLATCAECQAVLGDAVGIDAALSSGARRRRWPGVAGALAVAAALALVIGVAWRQPSHDAPQISAISLPAARVVEARFSGDRFAQHRPRSVGRAGGVPREEIPLATLAALEQREDLHDLLAALVATGDLARATEVATRIGHAANAETDLAALALATNDPEAALGHARAALRQRHDDPAATWNLGLAARELGLPRVARAAFERVAARGEPGWSDEARGYAAALGRELAASDGFAAFAVRARAMVAGGAPISDEEVALYPGLARQAFYDAARLAGDAARVATLRPLAATLDRASGVPTATAVLARIDPAIASRFTEAYRKVIAYAATPSEASALIDQLRIAGRGADDLRVGAIVLSGQAVARVDELASIIASWNDPWFTIFVERTRLLAKYDPHDLRREPGLRAALAACKGDAWSLRCGQLAQELAELQFGWGRTTDAERSARDAVERYRIAGTPSLLVRARALVAELHRLGGRRTLAHTDLEEIRLAASADDCDIRRYAAINEAELAIVDADWDAARTSLPTAALPEGCTASGDLIGVATAVDLARATQLPADIAVATAWIAAGAKDLDPAVAMIGALRVGRGDVAAVRAWLQQPVAREDLEVASLRTWAQTTLIDEAGKAKDWDAVVSVVADQNAPCVLVVSSDDDRMTVAARTPTGLMGEHWRVPVHAQTRLVSGDIIDALRTCTEIPVIAVRPLHGRSDLLPIELPWWFASDVPRTVRTTPARALEVVDARPPDPSLPRLAPTASTQRFAQQLAGADATPRHVLAALAAATYAELHVHGVAAAHNADAAYLALSPDPDGDYDLRAAEVETAKLAAHPVVVLAACRAASVAPYLRDRWSLPDAFVTAGASAVIAADVVIPDAEARAVFDSLHQKLDAGMSVAAAVALVRREGKSEWVKHLMVFAGR